MKNHLQFLFIFTLTILIFSSCSTLSSVADDDVYVLNAPSLNTDEDINDETSYHNYKNNKEKRRSNVCYGDTWRGVNIYFGSPYSYYGSGSLGQNWYYSPYDHAYYSPYYNNYWGYPSYYSPHYYDNPNYYYGGNPYNNYYSPYNNYYSPYNNYYYPYNNSNFGYNPTYTAGHKNYHNSARFTIGGKNNSGRRSNSTIYKGNMVGKMAGTSNPPSGSGNRYSPKSAYSRTTVASSRPVERGVGLSRSGSRVSASPYSGRGQNNAGSGGGNVRNGSGRNEGGTRQKSNDSSPRQGSVKSNQGSTKAPSGRRVH